MEIDSNTNMTAPSAVVGIRTTDRTGGMRNDKYV